MSITRKLPRNRVLLTILLGLVGVALTPLLAATPTYQWSTFVGQASAGSNDGKGAAARFNAPFGLAFDAVGNCYVADKNNHTIRRIAPGGAVTTLAGSPRQSGSADGAGAVARFNLPEGVAVDNLGGIYVADTGNHAIRKVSTTGVVTTFAGVAGTASSIDGPVATATFKNPTQIGVDGAGRVYVLDDSGVRRIANGQVETLYQAGGTVTVPPYQGAATLATVLVGSLNGMAVDRDGQVFIVATIRYLQGGTGDWGGLLKRDALGTVTGLEGQPLLYGSSLVNFRRVAVDNAGNVAVLGSTVSTGMRAPIFLFRTDGSWVRQNYIYRSNGQDIDANGVAIGPSGDVYFARADNSVFRWFALSAMELVAGVSLDSLPFDAPASIAVDSPGNVWVATEPTGVAYGNPSWAISLKKIAPDGTLTTPIPAVYSLAGGEAQPFVTANNSRGVNFLHGTFFQPANTQIAADGTMTEGPLIFKIPPDQVISSVYAAGFLVDANGRFVMADFSRHVVWRQASDGTWQILAGKQGESGSADGPGSDARFRRIDALAGDRAGNFYVLDSDDGSQTVPATTFLRKVTANGTVTTLSGNLRQVMPELSTSLHRPLALAVDSKGVFYLTYPTLNSVWRFEAAGTPMLIGGKAGATGDTDGVGEVARFYAPSYIAVDAQDRLLVVDAGILRRAVALLGPGITAEPQSATVAAGGAVQFSVTATGTPEPTYQWNFNGAAIAGATAASYSIGSAQAANAGNYTVTVSNSQGSMTSSTAVLTVTTGGGGNNNGGSGSAGGGGAPGIWFYLVLGVVVVIRFGRARVSESS